MKKINIFYWTVTGIFAAFMLAFSIPDIIMIPEAKEGFKQMGYPAYLLPFIGTAKVLGVIAILVPGFPRLKEWAYAGLVFDLLGATYSLIASGFPPSDYAGMILPLAMVTASYVLYHKKLKLQTSTPLRYAV